MRKPTLTTKSTVLCMFILACASLALGQQRTFVSGTGNDANACTSVTTPCRTFQRGHNAVAAGGEVVALTSAGYGSLNITKSVTISGEGIRAAITAAAGGNGVTITAPGATVILREVTIEGNNGTGIDGVHVANAAIVYIERCVITSFDGDGIDYRTPNRLFVTDTISRSNGGSGLVVTAPGGGTARINVDSSRFQRNDLEGIDLFGTTIEASITNSILSENGNGGLEVIGSGIRANVAHSTAANNDGNGFAVSSAGNQLNIEYSVARGNTISGMVVSSGTIRVTNSVSTNNGTGFNNGGGTFESRSALNNGVAPGLNTVAGNGTNVSGTITYFNPN